MSNEENDELPPATLFFSRRAQLVAKVSPEEIKAATQLLNRNQDGKLKNPSEDSSNASTNDEIVLSSFLKPIQKPTRSRRIKKSFLGENLEEEDVENESANFSPEVSLSAAAKRRVLKREKERDLELKLVDEENQKLLSSLKSTEFDEVEEISVDNAFNNVIVLTITYLSELSRLKCYESDKFSAILPKVAEQFNLNASEFLLSHNEQIIDVDDTPKSLNISVTDVLECIPYKADGNTSGENQYDTNNLKILFQSSDAKQQKVELLVHKLEKMQNIMEKYSQQRDIPLHLLIFEFDGERIRGSETPDDLDMESGNTIDVQILCPVVKTPKPPTPKKRTPRKRTPRKRAAKKTAAQSRGKQAKNNDDDDVLMVDSDDSDVLLCD